MRQHNRKSIRLKGYDYSSPGEYFVTVCTYNHGCLFGNIIDENMRLSEIGRIAEQCWKELPAKFINVILDEYIIMPNHIHGIIIINECRDLINQIPTKNFPLMQNPKITLGKILRNFKARTSKCIHDSGYTEFQWQSRFYEHIIRNDKELNNIRDYIINNPIKWSFDIEYPDNQ